ncbi:hypothetical protein HYQ45_010709 [Verticillium longisporum]|uniref:SWI-SNF chromatin-remodeling complex protein n=1 Tax=Verticillium longisporum TaxID=100787 RepID=A0A8I3AQQ9_VERLO|nr:hypothetical protein HYQ45_010709 [Verticillium longisporum]
MDGSYQNPYHRANSPMSPETPTSAPYRANVNRTKTRKWVEAKTQNYDGDDWGGDDFDEEPEPVPVPPLRPTGSRQTSLSSQTWNQPPPMPQVGHRYASGPQPSLHIQTQPVQVPLQLSQSQAEQQQPRETTAASEIKSPVGPEPSSSVYSQGTGQVVSPQSASSGAITAPVTVPEPWRFPPRKSSISQGEPQAAQQQTTLPSTVFRRSEEDTTAGNPQSSHIAGKNVEESVASQPGRSIAHNEGTTPAHTSLGSTSRAGMPQDTVHGGKSDDGFDRTPSPPKLDQGQTQQASALESAPAPVEQPQPTERFSTAVIAEPQAILPSRQYEASSPTSIVEQASHNAARAQEEPRRFSTSPQLPDLARMSMFGDDFFAKPPLTSNAPPVPTLPEESEPSPQLPLASQTLPAMDRSATTPRTDTTTILSTDQTESPFQPTHDISPKPDGTTAEVAPTSNVTETPTDEIESREPSRPERAEQKRPSFPGGCVTETATPAATPAAETEPAVNPSESAPTERSNMPAISDDEGGSPAAFEPVPLKGLQSTSGPGSVTASDDHVQRAASPIASLSISPAPEGQSSTLAALQTRPVDDPPEKFAAPERQSTLSTINSPSPIKESDKLREEIIRTLSPVRPTHDNDATGDSKGGLSVLPSQAGRESTYLHGVYDDYWSGPEDRPPHSKQDDTDPAPAIPATDGTMLSSPRDVSDIPPLSPRSPRREPVDVPAAVPGVNLLPRRFSWEASNEDQPQSAEQSSADASAPQFAVNVSSGPSSQHSQPLAPSIGNPEEPTNDDDKPPSSAADELPSRLADKSQIGILDNTALVSHQVSQVSTLPREKQDSVGPEPPSPISAASDKPPPFKEEPEPKTRRISLADETRLQVSTSDQTSPLPSPGGHPALAEPTVAVGSEAEGSPTQHHIPAQSTQPAQKLLSFREILDLPSPADRIAKYNETRAQFASMDSGLNNWIVSLQSQHAEHGAASSSYHTSITAAPPGSASAQRSPTNAPSASQQPYYQQYLNASSPNATPGAPGRPSTSNMGTGASHSPSSDFKHSSGQVGAKGKELLLGAAKAGKGLLSKGKNKLRGGDKNEESSSSSSPPPPQSKARNDRRASWGLSLGPRSSGLKGDADPQSNSPQPRRLSTVSSSAPKIPQPLRLSPLDTFPNPTGVPWATSQPRPRTPPNGVNAQGESQPELVSPVSDTHSMRKAQHGDNTNDEHDAADSVQIPQPISKTQPSWDPTNATPLFEENDFDLHHSQPSSIPNGRSVAPADDRDDDWVVVEPQAPGEPYRMVPSGASKQPASGPTMTQRATSSEVPRSNATHTQQAPPETSPQRNSSFIGLPPIRRTSTFGINYARRAKERFSLDEDEMDNFSRTSTLDATAGPSTLSSQQQQQQYNSAAAQQSGDLPTGTGAQTRDSQQGLAGDTLGASSLGRTASYASSEVDVGDDPEKPPVAEPAPYQNRRTAPMQHQNMRPQPGVLGQNIPGGNPVQHLPPQGPWKLEESHLSEPLLPASRSRHAPDTSQAYFGFDKETGVTNPVPMQQRSAVQMPPRQKFSETPPSSARRYPELFSRAVGQQQPPPQQQLQQQQQQPQQQQQSQKHLDQAMSRTSQDLLPQVYQQQPPSREDVILQRSNTSEFQVPGVGPPPEDHRGRERRGSGIFKEIGGRFRTASRERKGSVIEGSGLTQQPGVDVRGDEVSESSFDTQELRDRKKKRRSSFFMSLRGSKPASSDGPPGASGDDTANSSDVAEQPQTHAQLQHQFADQRKRSFFGSTPGSGLGLPTLSRTSTSSNVHETEGSLHGHQSPKKRLSTLTGKFFHRSSGQVEEPPKPMTAQFTTPSLQSRLSGLPNTQPGVPSPLADHRRDRSDTTTSRPPIDHEPQYLNQGDAHDVKHADRGRRASAGNFLTGLLGNRSSSKPREAHPQPERLPQDQPQQFQFQRQPQAQAGQVGHQPSPQPVFQPGTGDAQHVNRVASPEQRGQGSFPGPQKAPDSTRVSVQQVDSDTDEAGRKSTLGQFLM